MTNWKVHQSIQLWPNLRYWPGIYLEELRKQEITVRTARIPADIQTSSHPITTRKHYTCTKHGHFSLKVWKHSGQWRHGKEGKAVKNFTQFHELQYVVYSLLFLLFFMNRLCLFFWGLALMSTADFTTFTALLMSPCWRWLHKRAPSCLRFTAASLLSLSLSSSSICRGLNNVLRIYSFIQWHHQHCITGWFNKCSPLEG